MDAELLRGLVDWMRQRSDEEGRDGEEVEAAIYRECAGKLEAALSVAQGQGFVPSVQWMDEIHEEWCGSETDAGFIPYLRAAMLAAAPAQPDGVQS